MTDLSILRSAAALVKNRDLSVRIQEPIDEEVLSSGSLALDTLLETGGFRPGSIVEIVGAESCGKSTLGLHAIACAQSAGWPAAFVDVDHKYNSTWAETLGVKAQELPILQENDADVISSFVRESVHKGIKLVVIDTITGVTSLLGTPESHVSTLKKLLNSLAAAAMETRAIIILTNEIRSGAFTEGLLKRDNYNISAGWSVVHPIASVRVHLRVVERLANDHKPIGVRVCAEVLKNRWSIGMVKTKETEFNILFSEGVDQYSEVLDAALIAGLAKKEAQTYYFKFDGFDWCTTGRQKTLELLRNTPLLFGELREAVFVKSFENARLGSR